jgi:hypothetical protein
VGAPPGVLAADSPDEEPAGEAAAPVEPAAAHTIPSHDPTRDFAPIDQDRIFVRTLCDLLINSRLKVALHRPAANAAERDLAADLAGYDCVVVVGEPAELSLDQIRGAAGLVVDARDYRFRAGTSQATAYRASPGEVSAVYTGVVPIVYKAQRMLLDSLIQSTFWSVIMITPLLMFIARSAAAGLVAMLPNVLPVLMVFGGMGWLGIDVDVGAMMTASIALGVAVDDTIHYLNWFREELDRLGDRKQAILAAYKHCATPTIQAATIGGLGLSIFAVSTFTPTQRFGILMLVILWLGAVAELIFFPALLAGPLGSFFKPRKKAVPQAASEAPAADGPPQLQIVRHDDMPDEDAEVDAEEAAASEAAAPVPPPHSPAPGVRTRRDGLHRKRG